MDWKPISESSLWDLINEAEQRMDVRQVRFWELIRVPPQKWHEKSYGELGGGFWVVAIVGVTVIWYNDIEDGFNRSSYSQFGTIDEYWCNQDELEHAVQQVIHAIETGQDHALKCSPPISGTYEPA